MKNASVKQLKRTVEYKDGKTWKTKTVTMHVDDYQAGLRLLERSLTHEHGSRGWRFKKS